MSAALPFQVRVRPMSLEDIPQVVAIDRVSFTLPWPETAFNYEVAENEASLTMVCEALYPDGDRRIAGMIVVWLIVDEAHIATFATHPDFRRLGLARRLLAETLLVCIRAGMYSSTLEVRAANLAAQNLYLAFRFEEVGRRPRYYRDNNEDALIMTVQPLDDIYEEWLQAVLTGAVTEIGADPRFAEDSPTDAAALPETPAGVE